MNRPSAERRTYDVTVTREVLGIRQKPKKRQQALPRIRLLSLVLLITLVAVLGHLLTSPAYSINGAAVRGNSLVEAQTIYQTSQMHGQNLFLLNSERVAQAIERLPYIKRAQVRVRLPAQVAIIVEEYRPRWAWLTDENRFWIDETGIILPGNGTFQGTLTVIDESGRPLPVGASIEPRVVETLDALNQLLPGLKRVTYDPQRGFILTAGPGWPVRIGHNSDRLADQIGILKSLLPELMSQGRDVEFIDLRFVERPYYRFEK